MSPMTEGWWSLRIEKFLLSCYFTIASSREQRLTSSGYLTKAQSVKLHPSKHEKQEKKTNGCVPQVRKEKRMKAATNPKRTERHVVSAGCEGHVLVVKCCNRRGSVFSEYPETPPTYSSAKGPL